jgi:uncharacterized membrane protein (DUF373 family)
MAGQQRSPGRSALGTDSVIIWLIVVLEYAIVLSLLLVAGVVLVRTIVAFLREWSAFPDSVIGAIDGILVVIILLDIIHTVFRHLRSSVFPVRPFLVIGVLAGVREVLSSSARLTLAPHLRTSNFHETIIALGAGVGVVVFMLFALVLLKVSGHVDETATLPARSSLRAVGADPDAAAGEPAAAGAIARATLGPPEQ